MIVNDLLCLFLIDFIIHLENCFIPVIILTYRAIEYFQVEYVSSEPMIYGETKVDFPVGDYFMHYPRLADIVVLLAILFLF